MHERNKTKTNKKSCCVIEKDLEEKDNLWLCLRKNQANKKMSICVQAHKGKIDIWMTKREKKKNIYAQEKQQRNEASTNVFISSITCQSKEIRLIKSEHRVSGIGYLSSSCRFTEKKALKIKMKRTYTHELLVFFISLQIFLIYLLFSFWYFFCVVFFFRCL